MNMIHRVCILAIIVCISIASAQQKEYTVTKILPVPDSLRTQYDTLIVDHVNAEKLRRGWPTLKKGMSKSRVVSLLGKPTDIEYSSFDESETWHYGKSRVVFDRIKDTLRNWEK